MHNEAHYCGICHVIVAPADPNRLERGGEAAHGSCVARDGFRGVRREAESFLSMRGGESARRQFVAEAASARRPRQFAEALSNALAALYAASGNGMSSRRETISAFAAEASAKLYCEVAVSGRPVRQKERRA